MNVTRDGALTPSSSRTRTVSSLLVGSMIRARTSARNVSSPTAPNPSASYTPHNARHRISEPVASTTGVPGSAGCGGVRSISSACWSACRRCFAVSSSSASWSSSWADPMWSIPSTICTAVAPEPVFTRRTNEPTRRGYPPAAPRLVTST